MVVILEEGWKVQFSMGRIYHSLLAITITYE